MAPESPPPTAARARRAIALLTVIALAAVPAAAQAPPARYGGRSLTDALLELRAQGLKIVFTSEVVRPEMTVGAEPAASDPRRILDELLAPHGLEAREGPGGTLVVVARGGPPPPAVASLAGVVRSRRDAAPVAGVAVRVAELDREAVTAADGAFQLSGLPPGAYTLEVRRRGFVVIRLAGIVVAPGEAAELSILLDPAPVAEEELVVTPSRLSLLREAPIAPLALSRDDLLALPHLGDDFFRALSVLPGVAANDVSAEFHVRGGRRDETRILLDGQELYDTYHLMDFDSALSVVAPATVENVDLSTGGFAVEHGDRMSGVLDITTRTPTGPPRVELGVALLNAHAGGAGTFDEGRGSWIAQARRGAIDLAGRLLGDEEPRYWDAFGKLDYQLTARTSLSGHLLHADDELEFEEVGEDGEKRHATEYRSAYLWLTQRTQVGAEAFFETAASRSRVDRDRRGLEIEEDVEFEVADERELEVLALRQDWHWQAAPRHYLKAGLELRDFETRFDYRGRFRFESPIALLRTNGEAGEILFRDRFDERHESLYVADRVRLGGPVTAEVGARYDRHSQSGERLASPRLNLAWATSRHGVLRAAWGRFLQSQRPYELQVEDGETELARVERSEHRVLGYEHLFEGVTARDLVVRLELYRRRVDNPLPRYENLYEPLNTFPEVEPDRVRVAPRESVAEGFEIFVRGGAGRRVGWWVNYARAATEDEIDGRWVARPFDQTDSVNVDLDVRLGARWTLNLAWRYHSGWPTTPLGLAVEEDEEGELEITPVLGPLFGERLPDYHRLDLRASRWWPARAGRLELFVEVQNLYDRANVAGFDFEVDDETATLVGHEETWPGIVPSAGISWAF